MDILQRCSLKSLYIFSVAARHLNFSRAADELSITASAISHQIARLENTLGCPLFIREGKTLLLTPEAHQYALLLDQAFHGVRQATTDFMQKESKVIHFGVDGAFAVRRLAQALGIWQESNPQLDVRLRMISCEDDPATLNLDVVLSSRVRHPQYHSQFINAESYHIVCNSALHRSLKQKPLSDLLATNTLLDIENVNTWQVWGDAQGVSCPASSRMAFFSHTLLLIQATLAGQGLALLDKSLIKNELDNGELVILNETGFSPDNSGYYLSVQKHWRHHQGIKNLSNWVSSLF